MKAPANPDYPYRQIGESDAAHKRRLVAYYEKITKYEAFLKWEAANKKAEERKETRQFRAEDVQTAKTCFAAIPDDVILTMAVQDFDMSNPESCVCGWAFKLGMEKLKGEFGGLHSVMELDSHKNTSKGCSKLYNGATKEQWYRLYIAVTSDLRLPIYERAFVDRVLEACA
jgi:hypothetical protein